MIERENSKQETALLDQYEPGWRAQGYEVVRQPTAQALPEFLSLYQPDAILLGKSPNIVVQIVRKGQPNMQNRLKQLNSLLSGRGDWRLEVLYAGAHQATLPSIPAERIRNSKLESEKLIEIDPRGALLLLWATLEAACRRLIPNETERPQSPARVVELLATAGYVLPREASSLRHLAELRNRLVHGDLEVSPSRHELEQLASILSQLIDGLDSAS